MKTLVLAIATLIAGAVASALMLVLAYDVLTGANASVPYDHSKFLLKSVASPRIIIDGGSSSMFGIVPAMMEKELRVPVVDAADNGSIPLRMKIYRVFQYARPGDTIILPLEWVYYTRSEIPSDFIDKTPDEYASYYISMPFLERLQFIVTSLSLHNVSDAFRLHFKPGLSHEHLRTIEDLLERFPHGDRKDDSRRRSSVGNIGCSDYLGSDGTIVAEMRWAARALRELEALRGVRILIAWPAVAGDDCYRSDTLEQDARDLFSQHGLTVLGTASDAYFSASHMLDTYYHVDSVAAELRTKRLITQLLATPGFTFQVTEGYRPTVDQGRAALAILSHSQMQPYARIGPLSLLSQ